MPGLMTLGVAWYVIVEYPQATIVFWGLHVLRILKVDYTFNVVINPFKPDFTLSFSSTTSRELLSRLIVDEDDLKWVKNQRKLP